MTGDTDMDRVYYVRLLAKRSLRDSVLTPRVSEAENAAGRGKRDRVR